MENLYDLTKAELVGQLLEYKNKEKFRCRHGHSGLSHKNCYFKELGIEQKIAIFDIETFELYADWGFMFCYCLKELEGDIITGCIRGKDVINHKVRDKKLVQQLCKDLKKFDVLVVYYGKDTGGKWQRHDISFARTRAWHWHIKSFPKDREKTIIDVYDIVKAKSKMKSNSLEHACSLFDIPVKLSPHSPDIWQRARDGNEKALGYVVKHCEEDVIATEALYKEVYEYKKVKSMI